MKIVGYILVAAGYASLAVSILAMLVMISLALVEIIPFFPPPSKLPLYGFFGGIWLVILGGAVLLVDLLVREWKKK